MRFEVTNLGRIRHAVMDLAPFTVFVGENGTNKTWAAYALYGLLASDGALARLDTETAQFVASIVDQTIGDDWPADDTVFFRRDLLERFQRDHATLALGPDEICRVLGAELRFREDCAARLEVNLNNLQGARVSERLTTDGRSVAMVSEVAGNRVVLTTLPASTTRREALTKMLVSLLVRGSGRTVVFPTERVALNARNIALALDQEPHDFVLTAYKVFLAGTVVDGLELGWSDALKAFSSGVLGGSVTLDEGNTSLNFTASGQQGSLPVVTSASVVKSLAGLSIYLDAGPTPGDTLIIDEPEMNAHPAAQLAIVECLASLVKRGVRIVITTHSPFVLDHLGTLVEASQVEGTARERIVEKLKLKSADALLQPSDLAVYRFDRSGKVSSIYDPESRVIDGSVFSDVGDAEANLFSDVLAAERRP